TTFTDSPLPSTAAPNNAIYPLWDDLEIFAPAAVYFQTIGASPNRIFIVDWNNVGQFSSGGNPATFEVKLYETSNVIEMHYQAVAGELTAGDTSTVGIENSNGTAATQFSSSTNTRTLLQGLIANGQALSYAPSGSTICAPGACCLSNPDQCQTMLLSQCTAGG